MGQIVHALIEHKLTLGEILELPDYLRHISDSILAGQWQWTIPNINNQILTDLWTRKSEYFINKTCSEKDVALLVNGKIVLHFSAPYLVTFHNSLSWDTYRKNEQLREGFNDLTRSILSILNAVDILFVPDLSSVDFFNEDEDLTVNAYRKKANGNEMYAIELG